MPHQVSELHREAAVGIVLNVHDFSVVGQNEKLAAPEGVQTNSGNLPEYLEACCVSTSPSGGRLWVGEVNLPVTRRQGTQPTITGQCYAAFYRARMTLQAWSYSHSAWGEVPGHTHTRTNTHKQMSRFQPGGEEHRPKNFYSSKRLNGAQRKHSLVKCCFYFQLIVHLRQLNKKPEKKKHALEEGNLLENCGFNRKRGVIPDFGGELYSGFDDQGLLWVCGHARLLLHHKRAENGRVEKLIWIFVVVVVHRQLQPLAGP